MVALRRFSERSQRSVGQELQTRTKTDLSLLNRADVVQTGVPSATNETALLYHLYSRGEDRPERPGSLETTSARMLDLIVLGDKAFREQDFGTALDMYERAVGFDDGENLGLRFDPLYHRAGVLLQNAYTISGRLEDARSLLAGLTAEHQGNPEFAYYHARVLA